MELVTAVRGVSSYLPVCPPTQTISTLSREEHPATSATAKLHFLAAARCTAPSHPCEPAGPRSRRPNTSHLSPRGPAPWRRALAHRRSFVWWLGSNTGCSPAACRLAPSAVEVAPPYRDLRPQQENCGGVGRGAGGPGGVGGPVPHHRCLVALLHFFMFTVEPPNITIPRHRCPGTAVRKTDGSG